MQNHMHERYAELFRGIAGEYGYEVVEMEVAGKNHYRISLCFHIPLGKQ